MIMFLLSKKINNEILRNKTKILILAKRTNKTKATQLDKFKSSKLLNKIIETQAKYKDDLLFVRVGDFYEVYFDQASLAGNLLGLKVIDKKYKNSRYKFTGFPVKNIEKYVKTIIKEYNKKVVVMEQFVKNKEIDREINRIYSLGTLMGDRYCDLKVENNLLCIKLEENDTGLVSLSYVDVNNFKVKNLKIERNIIKNEIEKIAPREILVLRRDVDQNVEFFNSFIHSNSYMVTFITNEEITGCKATSLDVLTAYIQKMYNNKQIKINTSIKSNSTEMQIYQSALKSLNLIIKGQKYTIEKIINKHKTGCGSRLFRERITRPTLILEEIVRRQKMIEFFVQNEDTIPEFSKYLMSFTDIISISMQFYIGLNKISNKGVEALLNIANGLKNAYFVKQHLKRCNLNKELKNLYNQFLDLNGLAQNIIESVNKDHDCLREQETNGSPMFFFKLEKNDKIKEHYKEIAKFKEKKEKLQTNYETEYGVSSVKLLNSSKFGYFVEVNGVRNCSKIEKNNRINIFSKTKSKIRFYCLKWIKMSTELNDFYSKISEIEETIYSEFRAKIIENINTINNISDTMAELDISINMANLGKELNLTLPIYEKENKDLLVKGSRNLCVECSLLERNNKQKYVKNDIELKEKEQKTIVLTGPNMGGKSTFLRQVGLIAIMGQAGLMVPCDYAKLPIIDKIFTRIGSGDDITNNESTFMTEMKETSIILKEATKESLVIVDEIGRGTSHLEGVSLAYSVLFQLVCKIKSFNLFATHFHELSNIIENNQKQMLEKIKFKKMQVIHLNNNDNTIFSFCLVPGICTHSMAFKVAKLSGLPTCVVNMAQLQYKKLNKQ